jgi:hypothetical protein
MLNIIALGKLKYKIPYRKNTVDKKLGITILITSKSDMLITSTLSPFALAVDSFSMFPSVSRLSG